MSYTLKTCSFLYVFYTYIKSFKNSLFITQKNPPPLDVKEFTSIYKHYNVNPMQAKIFSAFI